MIFVFSRQDNHTRQMEIPEETQKKANELKLEKSEFEKCGSLGSNKTNDLSEMEFIAEAVKASKSVKKSGKEKKKKKQK